MTLRRMTLHGIHARLIRLAGALSLALAAGLPGAALAAGDSLPPSLPGSQVPVAGASVDAITPSTVVVSRAAYQKQIILSCGNNFCNNLLFLAPNNKRLELSREICLISDAMGRVEYAHMVLNTTFDIPLGASWTGNSTTDGVTTYVYTFEQAAPLVITAGKSLYAQIVGAHSTGAPVLNGVCTIYGSLVTLK